MRPSPLSPNSPDASRPGLIVSAMMLWLSVLPSSAGAAEIMILGTFHMDNPGKDLINVDSDDVLAPERQAEILAVTQSLAKFAPTKIAIELLPESEDRFNGLYQDYRKGERPLSRDERQQIGMRLAAMLDLPLLYAVDVSADLDFSVMDRGEEFGQAEEVAAIYEDIERTRTEMAVAYGPDRSIAQRLRHANGPFSMDGNSFYMRFAALGSAAEPLGADMVATWYQRNLRIFGNILRLIDNDDDRILVIYGSGHLAQLSRFVEDHPDVNLVSAMEYLPD